jgi:hypothetical protein
LHRNPDAKEVYQQISHVGLDEWLVHRPIVENIGLMGAIALPRKIFQNAEKLS